MRFKVVSKSHRGSKPFIIHIQDALPNQQRVLRIEQRDAPFLSVGDTGKIMQGRDKLRFVLDAIDA